MTLAVLKVVLDRHRLLPACGIASVEHAVPTARAILDGGLDIMEVTFRNAQAAQCIRVIRESVPDIAVGAGTLLTERQVEAAIASGAQFGLTPGFNPTVVRHAIQCGFTMIPGVLTPGEIEQALELGCVLVKVFPVSSVGGADYVRALAGPYAQTGLRIIPFGGVNDENLQHFLSQPLVHAVGGSWLTPQPLTEVGRWSEVAACVAKTVELSKRAGRAQI